VVTDACGRRNFFSQPLLINASPLPIALLDFTAKYKKPGMVSLKWATATEINNNYFTLSRSSDGKNFTTWKNIPGKGNTNSEVQYSIDDPEPLSGISYYRLHQTDFDGTQTELKTVTVREQVNGSKNDKITVQPNPFHDRFTIKYFSETDGQGYLRMWNAGGRPVYEQQVALYTGWNQIEINLQDDLPGGNYVLRIINNTFTSGAVTIIKK
jgi:hypothetical protein